MEHWLEREIAQWVHHEGSIRGPIAPWANALTTELHLATPQARFLDMWSPWAAFSRGAVEAHPTLEYQKINGDKKYVEAPLVVEAPGQLPSLPSPKSRPGCPIPQCML